MKTLAPKATGTVLVEAVDAETVVTRDLSDEERSRQAITDYAAAYAGKKPIPPIEVFLVNGTMVLVDGWHRIQARVALNELGVVATCVGKGSAEDAIRYALTQTNQSHGLRLSPADRRCRVFRAMDSGLWDSAPAATVASDLGMSNHTAAKYMREWEEEQHRKGQPGLPSTVVDSSGKRRPRHQPRPQESPTKDTLEVLPNAPIGNVQSEDKDTLENFQSQSMLPMPGYGGQLLQLESEIRAIRTRVRRAIPNEAALTLTRQRVPELLKAAEVALSSAVPVACAGCQGDGCRSCGGRGWMTRLTGER